jgi:hypothetical protein
MSQDRSNNLQCNPWNVRLSLAFSDGSAYMSMLRIADGKVTETWHVQDIARLLAQISAAAR